VKRKVAERKADGALAAGMAAGGIVGAVLGKAVGRTNGSAVAGAAIGAMAGGALLRPIPALEVPELVTYLQMNLGPRTTAYLSGVDDVGLVGRWGQGDALPDEVSMQRLRSAYLAARCLVEAYDAQTARSWFMGMNPGFDDEAPARVLRHSRSPGAWEDVVLAAREFAES
jgi:hypothetical protein